MSYGTMLNAKMRKILTKCILPPQALRENFGQVRKMRVFTFLKVARKFASPANVPGKGPAEEVEVHIY